MNEFGRSVCVGGKRFLCYDATLQNATLTSPFEAIFRLNFDQLTSCYIWMESLFRNLAIDIRGAVLISKLCS